jgi:hypothetical protein
MNWTEDQWFQVRSTLAAGWVIDQGYSETAYRGLLTTYEPQDVLFALRSLLGRGSRFVPKVAEIVAALPSRAMLGVVPQASETRLARLAALEIADGIENARRDRELEEWVHDHGRPEAVR